MADPTQSGGSQTDDVLDIIDNSGEPSSKAGPRPLSPRELVMQSMESKLATERGVQLPSEAEEPGDGTGASNGEEDEALSEEEQKLADSINGKATSEQDPLADFIVRDAKGVPHIKLKVDGQDRLVTLDAARTNLQKNEAADVRLQQAAETTRQANALREQVERDRQALATRTQLPAQADVSDEALLAQSRELVSSLISDPEDVAAAKMAKALRNISQASRPAVDENAIVTRAVTAVEQKHRQARVVEDTKSGFERFQTEFKDIADDPELFDMADHKSDAISKEHPDWTPSQVMTEAGLQTRKLVAKLRGTQVVEPPVQNDRQARKSNLKPLPQTRSARSGATQPVREPTPQEEFAALRRARGLGATAG